MVFFFKGTASKTTRRRFLLKSLLHHDVLSFGEFIAARNDVYVFNGLAILPPSIRKLALCHLKVT